MEGGLEKGSVHYVFVVIVVGDTFSNADTRDSHFPFDDGFLRGHS